MAGHNSRRAAHWLLLVLLVFGCNMPGVAAPATRPAGTAPAAMTPVSPPATAVPTGAPVPTDVPEATDAPAPEGLNPDPPERTLRLIFIHHSSGENWLSDDNGGLGRALGENNYFVSDTNYGWGPDAIGDRTDIVNWPEWFRGPDSDRYLEAVFAEDAQNSWYTRDLENPGGENEIVMFKSCFPNSQLEGHPDDPPAPGDGLTVANAKHIYNDLLQYFAARPDKLFVVITAPPVQDETYAANARAFNTWLAQAWLPENDYTERNVAVFDFYNVLTDAGNHHRYQDGAIEYVTDSGGDTSAYPSDPGDDHPSAAGNRKATREYAPWLNVMVHCWLGDGECP